jgi:hypothetical protein
LNSGEAIREGDDFFGHTVNVASRIMSRATGGQILVSEATRALSGPIEGLEFIDLGRRRLRGLRERLRLFEVVWWNDSFLALPSGKGNMLSAVVEILLTWFRMSSTRCNPFGF